MTNEQTMTIGFTSGILGGLVVRSVSLAAGMALAILLLAALFSGPISGGSGADGAPGEPIVHASQDSLIIIR